MYNLYLVHYSHIFSFSRGKYICCERSCTCMCVMRIAGTEHPITIWSELSFLFYVTNHMDMMAHTPAFLWVGEHSHHPDFHHATRGWQAYIFFQTSHCEIAASTLTIKPCRMTSQPPLHDPPHPTSAWPTLPHLSTA